MPPCSTLLPVKYWLYCFTRWSQHYAAALELQHETAITAQRDIIAAFAEGELAALADLWSLWGHAWTVTKDLVAKTRTFREMLVRSRRFLDQTQFQALVDRYKNSLTYSERGGSLHCPSLAQMDRLLQRDLSTDLDEVGEERVISISLHEHLLELARGGESAVGSRIRIVIDPC